MAATLNFPDLNFKKYKADSENVESLFFSLQEGLHSLKNEEYKSLCSQRYGDVISLEEFLTRVKSSAFFVAIYSGKKLLGLGELYPSNKDNLVEIAYFVFPKYQGQGLGYLLAENLLKMGLEDADITGFFAECEVTNTSSVNILNKINDSYPSSKVSTNEKYNPPTVVYLWETGVFH